MIHNGVACLCVCGNIAGNFVSLVSSMSGGSAKIVENELSMSTLLCRGAIFWSLFEFLNLILKFPIDVAPALAAAAAFLYFSIPLTSVLLKLTSSAVMVL